MLKQKTKIWLMSIVSVALCALLSFGVLFAMQPSNSASVTAYAKQPVVATPYATFSGGNGSESNPYQLSTADDLSKLSNDVRKGNSFENQYFILTNNINLASISSWLPIGLVSSVPFMGCFDGNGYAISNINLSANNAYNGLFGFISDAKIYNLQVKNVFANYTAVQDSIVGAVIGYMLSNCLVKGVIADGVDIKIIDNGYSVIQGAFVGGLGGSGSYFEMCAVENLVAHSTVGGFIGANSNYSNYNYFDHCYILNHKFISLDVNREFIWIHYSYYKYNNKYYFFHHNFKHYTSHDFSPMQFDYKFEPEEICEMFNAEPQVPVTWAVIDNEPKILGLGNVGFQNGSLDNASITYPSSKTVFALGENASITVSANNELTISNVKIMPFIYNLGVTYYSQTSYEALKNRVDFAYIVLNPASATYTFNIATLFGEIDGRQGCFTISVDTTGGTISALVGERLYDITSSIAVTTLTTKTASLKEGQQILPSIISSSAPSSYSNKYMSQVNKPFFTIEKGGDILAQITSSTFTLSQTHIADLENGATLFINYTNAYPFTINKLTNNVLSSQTYLLASTNGKLYQQSGNGFALVDLGANSPLVETNSNDKLHFLGYSDNAPSQPVDYYGIVENGKYLGWKPDCTMLIQAERANLNDNSEDYTITSISVQDFSKWDFQNMPTLTAVWGNETIKLITGIYSLVNGAYGLVPYYSISVNDQTSETGEFSVNKNAELSLKVVTEKSSPDINGFLSFSWELATLDNNVLTPLTTGFGELSNEKVNSVTLTNAKKQTSVLLILVPKTDVKVSDFNLSGLPDDFEPVITINGQEVDIENLPDFVYGNKYVVKIENLPDYLYISQVIIDNNNTIEIIERNTFSFIVNTNDDFEIEVVIDEHLLYNLWIYVLIALGILLLLTYIIIICINISKDDVDYNDTAFLSSAAITANSAGDEDASNEELVDEFGAYAENRQNKGKLKEQNLQPRKKQEKTDEKQKRKTKVNDSMGEVYDFEEYESGNKN